MELKTMSNEKIELLKPSQVAELLKVTVETLANWRYKGLGPSFVKRTPALRGRVLYRLSAVLEWEKNLVEHTMSVQQNAEAAYDRRSE
jgi:hypothetical protein